jgi:hypothetical protein
LWRTWRKWEMEWDSLERSDELPARALYHGHEIPRANEMEKTKGSVWQGGSWQSSARSTRHFSNPLIQRLHGDGGNTTMALVFKKRGQMCSESMGVTLAEARMSKRP